jgi:hypothetical protein
MEYFSTIWFKANLFILPFVILFGIVGYFLISKKRIGSLPDNEKSRMQQSLPKVILLYKLSLIVIPISLFILPPIYKLDNGIAYVIVFGLTLMYAAEFVGFFLIKRLLGNLGE